MDELPARVELLERRTRAQALTIGAYQEQTRTLRAELEAVRSALAEARVALARLTAERDASAARIAITADN